MDINITVTDEDFIIQKKIATINSTRFISLIETAQKLDMKCLSFIDLKNYLILNRLQCRYITTEIETMKSYDYVDQEILSFLESALKEASKDVHLYIVIHSEASKLILYETEEDYYGG